MREKGIASNRAKNIITVAVGSDALNRVRQNMKGGATAGNSDMRPSHSRTRRRQTAKMGDPEMRSRTASSAKKWIAVRPGMKSSTSGQMEGVVDE
jgi:hypothetical protein